MTYGFPVPFAGIRIYIGPMTRDDLMDFLAFLGRGCDTPDPENPEHEHFHNVAIAFDGNRIWGSELLGDCAQRWARTRFVDGVLGGQPVTSEEGKVVPPAT